MMTMRPRWIAAGLLLLALLPGDLAIAKLALGGDVLGAATRAGAQAAQRVALGSSRLAATVLGRGAARAGDVAEGAARWLAGADCTRGAGPAMDFDPESVPAARLAGGAAPHLPFRVIEREARCIAARQRALAVAREAMRAQGLLGADARLSVRESRHVRALVRHELRVITILGVRPTAAIPAPAPVAPVAPTAPVPAAGS